MNVNTDNQHRPSLRIATSSRIYEIICYSIKQCEAARDAIAIARLERTYTMRRQANILNLALVSPYINLVILCIQQMSI